jgi:hypothetical protein
VPGMWAQLRMGLNAQKANNTTQDPRKKRGHFQLEPLICAYMAYNCSMLSYLFQKAINAQNPGMSRDERIELRNSKGHEMTFKRYHRYSGKCKATLLLHHFPDPLLDLIAVIKGNVKYCVLCCLQTCYGTWITSV